MCTLSFSASGLNTGDAERRVSPSDWENTWDGMNVARDAVLTRDGCDLGFMGLGDPEQKAQIEAISAQAKTLRAHSDDLIVLGIGGSSLGGQAMLKALGKDNNPKSHRVHFVDNVDPQTLGCLLEKLDPHKTSVAVISKSGGTLETIAQLLVVRQWSLDGATDTTENAKRWVCITDPSKGHLRAWAQKRGLALLPIPQNVGGRFSALTAAGLLPAAYAGISIDEILVGGRQMAEHCRGAASASEDMAAQFALATCLAQNHLGSASLVIMPYSDRLKTMTAWFVQLWAESLGKRLDSSGHEVYAGQTPIAALGATDQHAQLQLFIEGPRDKCIMMIEVAEHGIRMPIPSDPSDLLHVGFLAGRDLADVMSAEYRATQSALLAAGVPVLSLALPCIDGHNLGQTMMFFEIATAYAGLYRDVDPFNQPGVEAGKQTALKILGAHSI